MSKMLFAAAIVFIMIATPFAATAGDVTEPTIWSSKDQYVPDEVVTIYGEGWQKYVYVTLEFEHPDFLETLVYEDIMVDLYGRFAFDGYVSEPLVQWETPVTVTATQYYDGEILTATTWFQDPAAYIQGYTINPVERWTTGDIKGYNEGDSVPFQAVLNKAQLGVDTVEMTIGLDYKDLNPISPPYGIDYLTQYWLDPPLPPFNTYPSSDEPFGVLASEGTITHQERLADSLDEGTNQIIQVWTFTFTFASTAKVAHIMFGAHMALTTGPDHLGASYYPGSSLHVRVVEMTPSDVSDEGNRDVPIALGELLMPPEMVLEKWVEPKAEADPQDFLPGETITFTIHWTNTGQADATCVKLWDQLDPVATILPGSFMLSTSEDPPISITPDIVTDTYFELTIAFWPGTGEMGVEFPPLDGYLQFQAVISLDVLPGTYLNNVWMSYTDDHGGSFPTLHAEAPFCIPNEPAIMIEKTGVEFAHVGDTVTYEYLVTNIGDVPLHDVVVIDDVVGVVSLGTFDGTLDPDESVTLYMDYLIGAMDPDPLKNIATVTGDDNYGRTVTDDDDHLIDILKPSVYISKTADMSCARLGELVTYTIYYENTAIDGETDLYDVVISDSLLGDFVIGYLAAGAWGEIVVSVPAVEVSADPDAEMPNYVTILGRDAGWLYVQDDSSWMVDILHPDIVIEKWVDGDWHCAEHGEVMTYWILVTAPNVDTDMLATVYDLMLSAVPLYNNWIAGGTSVLLGPYPFAMPYDMETVTNVATVEALDRQQHYAYDEASWTINIVHPSIEVDKYADNYMGCAAEDETVWYTIVVTNTGDIALDELWVVDPAAGLNFYTDEDLLPGDFETFHVCIDMPVGEEFINTAYAEAYDLQGHFILGEDSWRIDIVHPDIEVDKHADNYMGCAAEGETVWYTITVTNTGDIAFDDLYVVDLDAGLNFYTEDNLLPGESKPFHVSVVMPVGEEFTNTVFADAFDLQGHYVSGQDSWTIDLVHPDIEVDKYADNYMGCAAEGETVWYTIVVTNTGDIAFDDLWVVDTAAGLNYYTLDNLLPGEFETFHVSIVMPKGEEFTNTAYADAFDLQGHYVWGEDSWTIDIVHPDVIITKVADNDMRCAAEGEVVDYTITVTNTGDITLDYYWVDDWDTGFHAFVTDDLAPGASAIFYTSMAMPVGEEFTNVAEVDAYDLQGHEVTDTDSWWIDIVHPEVEVVKIADGRMGCAAEGETVWYTITVTNIGDITLKSGVVEDVPTSFFDIFYDLAPGESVDFHTSIVMPVGETFTNTVEVRALDLQDHVVSDTDSWTIDLVHPSVSITKVADYGMTCAAEGETVWYTITVTNTGDIALDYYYVDDWETGLHEFVTDNLAPGASKEFRTSEPMPVGETFTNYAYVDAWDLQGHYVYASDCWTIDIVHPSIVVDKYADNYMGCAAEGETVYYTIVVTNTGDIAFEDLWVVDWDTGFNYYTTDNLAPGASWTFHTSKAMPVGEEFINHVWADAYDLQGHYVWAEDSWRIDIVHPDVEITKVAWNEMGCAHVGETVWYTITVTNTGDITLENGVVNDYDIGFSDTFAMLAPGDSVDWDVSKLIEEADGEWFTNYAFVDAWDLQRHYVWDLSWWEIEILHPSVLIVKSGPTWASVGETIHYTIDVTNTGDTPLLWVDVYDTNSLGVGYYLGTILDLDIGETDSSLGYDFTVPAGAEQIFNIAWAYGYDKQYYEVYDDDDHTVNVYGLVGGFKYADLNKDGYRDVNEPGIDNWVVRLQGTLLSGGTYDQTRLTGADGSFSFLMLEAGDYVLSEEMLGGWVAFTPTSYSFSLGYGEAEARDFGNLPTGCISGHKWHDLDLDGFWDEGEPGVDAWTIYLSGTDITGAVIETSTQTAPDGSYSFTGLYPGVYDVFEVPTGAWFPTTLTSQHFEPTLEGGAFTIPDVDFGNAQYGQIIGCKWIDEFMNGVWDGGEDPVPDWVIWLEGDTLDGEHIGPIWTTTDDTGWYAFTGLKAGTYTVWEELPEGWVAPITPTSHEFTLDEGDIADCGKFGNVEYGSIPVGKFLDWDMDGDWDPVEPGIPGWKVTLTGVLNDQYGTIIGPIERYTDATGHYTFTDLLPGKYKVVEEQPEGWYCTNYNEKIVIITSGWDIPWNNIKFGNVPYTCLWGYKFDDLNGDGFWDEGEPGLPGWTITVTGVRADGVQIEPIVLTTDPDGKWITCYNLLPGTYLVTETMQEGWIATIEESYLVVLPVDRQVMEPTDYNLFDFGNFKLGKMWGYKYEDMDGDGVKDPEDTPISGWTIWIETPSGVWIPVETNDLGYWELVDLTAGWYYVEEGFDYNYYPTNDFYEWVLIESGSEVAVHTFLNTMYCHIWGYKFEDIDGDGTWDDNEPGLPGWTINLMLGDVVVDSTVTGAGGYYYFSYLEPGTYTVCEVQQTDWIATTDPCQTVTLVSGDMVEIDAFGNFHTVWIELFKFEDLMADGYYDEYYDFGMQWWFLVTPPVGDPYWVQTDIFGHVSVHLTLPGLYTIMEMDVDGWCPTTLSTIHVSVVSGHAYWLDWGQPFEWYYFEFGNFKCVEITLFKYEDVDSSGDYDSEIDRPVEGWKFTVDQYFSDRPAIVVYTDANGLATVEICGMYVGGYWAIIEWGIEGEHWCYVTPEFGSYDIYVESGHVYSPYYPMEQYRYEFGNFKCVEIVVYKYWDKCSNGAYDPFIGDPPEPFDELLEGWYFELYDETGMLVDWGWTDEDGIVTFTVCRAGTYTIMEYVEEGWVPIEPEGGVITFDIESGMDPIHVWFGNYEIVEVTIFKYEDLDSDGDYDDFDGDWTWDIGEDRPLTGWYFELARVGDPSTVYSGTTLNGWLTLYVSKSGLYILTEEDKVGWTHVNPSSGQSAFSITSGTIVPLQMFGNFHNVCIPVFKFDDRDGNGVYDAEVDDPIGGWSFTLWEWNWDTYEYDIYVGTEVTDETGYAWFCFDSAGYFMVKEESRDGWSWIFPCDGEYIFGVRSGSWASEPAPVWNACEERYELHFANFKMGKIYGYKWNDLNGNGLWDTGEPPLAGWTIHFQSVWGFFMYDEVETNELGYYEFTGLPPGYYDVWETVQDGWVPTSSDYVEWVDMTLGHTEKRIDFLNFEKGCIEGYKYEDLVGDGEYDPGEDTGLEGWWVYLYITTGVVETPEGLISGIFKIGETQTDATGHYEFCGLGPGLYQVSEENRNGWMHTSPSSSDIFLLHSGEVVSFDFLNFELGCIYGYKFNDLDGDGVWDPLEPGLPDWPIHMFRDSIYDVIYTTHTDADGMYSFCGLEPDYYFVYEDNVHDNPDWTATTTIADIKTVTSGARIQMPDFGNFKNVVIKVYKYVDVNGNGEFDNGDLDKEGWGFDLLDSLGNVVDSGVTDENGELIFVVKKGDTYTIREEDWTGWVHVEPADGDLEVFVQSGATIPTQKFGNYQLGRLYGQKFYDWNMDGIMNGEDYGLGNWVITIHGDLVNGGDFDDTRLTDSNGNFEFVGLLAGEYTVSEVVPLGWEPTKPASVVIDVESGDNEPIYFANVWWGKIWGFKFYDKNTDGIQDDDEPGLGGWTIVLSGMRDDGTPIYDTDVTDSTGYFEFDDVQSGLYYLSEMLQEDWEATTDLPIEIGLSGTGVFDEQFDIGNIRYAKVYGYKFLDTYQDCYPFWPNGIWDIPDEIGLGGWEITLDGYTDDGVHVHEVTYTDDIENIGYYEFTGLLPGMYTVSETLLKGFYATTPWSVSIMIYPFPDAPILYPIYFGNLLPSRDPELNFHLREGWNMWSTPMIVENLDAKTLLAEIGPNALLVMKINKSTTPEQLDTYAAGDPDRYNFPIVMGEGYYVYVWEETAFTLIGEFAASSTVSMTDGWNMIGHNTLTPVMASALLADVQGGEGLLIMGYNPLTGNLDTYASGDPLRYDFVVSPGRAYYIYVIGPSTLVY